jgi:hypothetical protein
MANRSIQKSQHLLKTLNEEMIFLNGLMAETEDLSTKMNSLTAQFIFVSSQLKGTWSAIEKMHQTWDKAEKEDTL